MASNETILRVLQRNGTDQLDRDATALSPDSVKLHGFGMKEWLQFAWSFAEKVNYFSVEDDQQPIGNWQQLFLDKDTELEAFLRRVDEEDGTITPHLTLFVCFLKLLELSGGRLNGITKRHLDFYYRDVLKITEIPAVEDKAHILFELAKSVSDYAVTPGTALDGSKDPSGKKRVYTIDEEINATRTVVAELRNVYNEHTIKDEPGLKNENRFSITAVPVANSADGFGKELKEEDPSWYPFGYYTHTSTGTTDQLQEELPGLPERPAAQLGFAVASPVMMLSEGERKVTVKLHFGKKITGDFTVNDLVQSFEIWFTGEKKWLGPFLLDNMEEKETLIDKKNNEILLVTKLGPDDLKVVGYDPAIHGEQFSTSFPVARFLLKTNTAAGYGVYKALTKQNLLTSVTVTVDVSGMKSLQLESDAGALNNTKPFYPFTTIPMRDSAFEIYNDEVFSKNWSELTVNMDWKNTPLDFKIHYTAYDQQFESTISQEKYSQLFGNFDPKAVDDEYTTIFDQLDDRLKIKAAQAKADKIKAKKDGQSQLAPEQSTPAPAPATGGSEATDNARAADDRKPNPIVTSNDYFKASVQVLHKEVWDVRRDEVLFKKTNSGTGLFRLTFTVDGQNLERGKTGPVRLVLRQPFLHHMFPRLYAVAISSKEPKTLIPNEPYTPFAENATLSYQASDTVEVYSGTIIQAIPPKEKASLRKEDLIRQREESFLQHSGASATDRESLVMKERTVPVKPSLFDERRVQFFHEHPFGQSEEHAQLKEKFGDTSTECHVLPTYCKGGELYIGLQGAQVSEMVSLLVQVVEGTENPRAKTFPEGQKIVWEILGNNVWHVLDSSLMVTNETDNFLRSGRVRFTIPSTATSVNTLLPTGLFWVRVKMLRRYDAVCKVLGIHAQAAVAEFDKRDNDLSHLTTGLPKGTITKLIERVSQVKSIQQPYPTFGGRPEETDALYYRRISERLRHKNRAIALWDYEHIVLQQFPEVYKVKCLNHTDADHFTVPGSVTLVVIPDTVSRNVFDIYQPRVSTSVLNSIRDHLSELHSMHVQLDVINPIYEEVQVSLGAKFYPGLDENLYRKRLEDDLRKFLSPWAFERAREITFGISLHRSTLIHYIEKLDYVDYVEDVEVFKNNVKQPRKCEPSNPKSILVSAKSHTVKIAQDKCKNKEAKAKATEEQCQL